MADVYANNRSILHKGDGLQHVAAPPDVCKTPSPGGPVPIPYPNIAMDSNLAKGAKKVKIHGKPVAHSGSNLSTSTGDEAGTAGGGILSSKFKGKMTWGSSSSDVKVEGKGVARFMDVSQHNENTFNTAFTSMGSANTGVAYGDDFTGPCPICKAGPSKHRILETKASAEYCKKVIDALKAKHAALKEDKDTSKNQLKKWANGFMVGVMICKCPDNKVWVAKSGTSFAEFEAAAKVPGVHKVIPGRGVAVDDLIKANTSGLASPEKKEIAIRDAWNMVERAREKRKDGYNPPGTCAAQKLLTKADGHAPIEMTEMFFDPNAGTSDAWSASYEWRVGDGAKKWDKLSALKQKAILQNKQTNKEQRPFSAGMSVASCHTCQATLYLTNCPVRQCP